MAVIRVRRGWRAILGALVIATAAASSAGAQAGYSFRGILQNVVELDALSAVKRRFSAQGDLQLITQSLYVSENANPFRDVQRLAIRPWVHYEVSDRTELTFGTSYLRYYEIPQVGAKAKDEVRVTLMGLFTQPLTVGSVYEQVRMELRNTRDEGADDWSHVPRLRLRFGQNYTFSKSIHKPRINVYQEVAFKYQRGTKALDSFRGYLAYGYKPRPPVSLTAGLLLKATLKSSGKSFDAYFGPSISLRYTFGVARRHERPPDPDPD